MWLTFGPSIHHVYSATLIDREEDRPDVVDLLRLVPAQDRPGADSAAAQAATRLLHPHARHRQRLLGQRQRRRGRAGAWPAWPMPAWRFLDSRTLGSCSCRSRSSRRYLLGGRIHGMPRSRSSLIGDHDVRRGHGARATAGEHRLRRRALPRAELTAVPARVTFVGIVQHRSPGVGLSRCSCRSADRDQPTMSFSTRSAGGGARRCRYARAWCATSPRWPTSPLISQCGMRLISSGVDVAAAAAAWQAGNWHPAGRRGVRSARPAALLQPAHVSTANHSQCPSCGAMRLSSPAPRS